MVDKIENKSKFLTYLLVAFFFATPIDYILPHFGTATVLTVIGLFISALAVFFAFSQESAKMTGEQTCILLLIMFMTASNLWAGDTNRSFSYTFSFVATAAMYFLLFFFKFTKEEINMFEIAAIIGGAIFVIYIFTDVDMALVRAGYRLQLEQIDDAEHFSDPNGLAARLIMPLVFTVKRLLEKSTLQLKLLYGGLLAAMVYVIFLTGSRAAVISLIVIGIIIFLSLDNKRVSNSIIFVFIALAIIILIPDLLPDHIFNRIFNIEKYQEVVTIKGDRIDVWTKTIFDVFPKSPIWGHGAGNTSNMLSEFYGFNKAVHSTWFTMLGDIGLIGFVLWVSIPFGKMKQAYAMRKNNVHVWAVLIGILLMASTLDAVLEKYLWNAFLYVHMIKTVYTPKEEVTLAEKLEQ